jgi:hypothetical protein
MSPKAIIDRISNEKDADLARNAIEELKRGILKDLMELETLLTEEENDLIAIGKQRQVEVLENIKAACTLADDVIAQNKILAGMISERDREIEDLKSEIKRLGKSGDIPYIDFLN